MTHPDYQRCVHCHCARKNHGPAEVCNGGATRFSSDPKRAEIRRFELMRQNKIRTRRRVVVAIPIYLMKGEA